MDCNRVEERDTVIDIEGCLNTSKGDGADEEIAENMAKVGHLMIPANVLQVPNESGKNKTKKSPASAKNKKPPKPPRPPRGLSLDAADQKLIKEIAELAMIKRARIERMKALKKMKADKASSSSSGNLIAILFTMVFCVLFILQGCQSSLGNRSAASSPVKSNGLAAEGNVYNTVPDSRDERQEGSIQKTSTSDLLQT